MTVELLKEFALRDPEVKAEYENLRDEFILIDQFVAMRNQVDLMHNDIVHTVNKR